jgi:hypothetical protein
MDGQERVFCHECQARWLRADHGLGCPNCSSDFTEIVGSRAVRFDAHPNSIQVGPRDDEPPDSVHGWDWDDAGESIPVPSLNPSAPSSPRHRIRHPSAPTPSHPSLSPFAPPGLRITRTGFSNYSLTGSPGGATPPDAGDGPPDGGFGGLGVLQLLQNAVAAAPEPNTGSHTMRFTGPNMNATVTVQSRTYGGGASAAAARDTRMRDMDQIHQ